MKLEAASLATLLLILHARSNNACTLPVPSTFNVENFNVMFKDKILNYTVASEESAAKVLESVHEINRNISEYVQKLTEYIIVDSSNSLRLSQFAPPLQDMVKISQACEVVLRYYKERIYEEFNEARQKDILTAGDYFLVHDRAYVLRLFRLFYGNVFHDLRDLNDRCIMGKSQHQFFSELLKYLQYIIAQTYTAVDILEQLFKSQESSFCDGKLIKLMLNEEYKRFTGQFQSFIKTLTKEFYTCNNSNSGTHNNPIELKAFQRYLFTTNQISPGYFYQVDNGCPNDCSVVNNLNVKDKIVCNNKKDSYAGPLQKAMDVRYNSSNDDVCLLTKKCNKLHCPKKGNARNPYGLVHMCINPHSEERYQYYRHNMKPQRECKGESKVLVYQERGDIVYFNGWKQYAKETSCPICDCVCADNDYYISTQYVLADILDHMVVLGSRFKMLENTLYIEILQGRLLPNGSIDHSTLSWKNASNVLQDMAQMRVKLDWNGMRSIDLTTTMVPEGHVIVGLGFTPVQGHEQRLGLRVLSTAYDFANGRLTEDYYKGSQTVAKKELQLVGTKKPKWSNDIRSVSKGDEFVTFTTSDELGDGAQSTIPFIDSQPVLPSIWKPLSGVGLFYKAQENFAGFIGFKLIEYGTE